MVMIRTYYRAMGMTMVEKILAAHSGRETVRPGEIVVVPVDTLVLMDLNFYDGAWHEPKRVFDPERVVIVFDHVVPAPNKASAAFLDRGRAFARRTGISRVHDVGSEQGISHAIVADVPYALPGEILVCSDSHTCSAGALNCAARGLGPPEIAFILAKGYTWFEVGTTVRYELTGALSPVAAPKDVFLHLAAQYGSHVATTIEFGGPGLATLSMDERRQLTTMTAEVSADFGVCEPDAVLAEHLVARGRSMDAAVLPDPDAGYEAVRTIDLTLIEPMVGLPDTLIHNAVPVSSLAGTAINRAFIGSCANGTLDDLRAAARVLRGQRVARGVTLLVTPASQAIYRRALREGVIETLMEAGALVTASSCGMCAGFENALGEHDVCIASSTRNFKGRMGHSEARIYLGSSATVAASAIAGKVVAEDASSAVGAGR
jgi:3-isopropylmalate/(R)-2-methylmalate dehydratase large subunit